MPATSYPSEFAVSPDDGLTHDCPVCGRGTLVPTECTEGHGDDCPDRLCLDCGSALFVDPVSESALRSA